MKFRIEKRHCYLVTDSITKLEEVADNLIEVEFEFDAEWSGITKTARFSKGWEGEYVDKIITNGKCSVSLPYGEWYVGVMSTNLTTTPCKVEMGISEKSYNGYPAPAQSIYQQILDKLDSLSGADPDMVAEQIEAYFEEHPIDGLTDDDVNTLIAAYLEENPQGVDTTAVNTLIASYLTANPQGLSESSVNSLIASYLTAHPQGVSESSVNTLIANYLTAHPQGLSESAVNGLIASYLTSNPQGLSETAVNNLIAAYLTAHPQGVDESSVNTLIAAYITAHPEIGSGGGNKVAYAASATSDTIIKIVEEEGEEIDLSDEIADAVEDYMEEHPISVEIDNNSIVRNSNNKLEVANYEELRQKYGGFTPVGEEVSLTWHTREYWNTSSKSVSTGATDGQWASIEVAEGEKYSVKGASFYNGKLIGIYDASMNLLSSYPSTSSATYYEYEFTIPTNGKYLYTNTLSASFSAYSLKKVTGRTFNGFDVYRKNNLYGKSMLVFGDSIARGSRANNNAFGEQIAKANAMTITNIAVGGSTFAETEGRGNIVTKIKNQAVANHDYIVFDGGTNDSDLNLPMGTLSASYTGEFDTTTTIGAVEELCRYLKTTYINSKILFVLTHKRIQYPNVTSRQATYWNAIISVLEKWGIPYVDLRTCGLAYYSADWGTTYFSNDNGGDTHPNELGYAMFYAPTIEAKMQSL